MLEVGWNQPATRKLPTFSVCSAQGGNYSSDVCNNPTGFISSSRIAENSVIIVIRIQVCTAMKDLLCAVDTEEIEISSSSPCKIVEKINHFNFKTV